MSNFNYKSFSGSSPRQAQSLQSGRNIQGWRKHHLQVMLSLNPSITTSIASIVTSITSSITTISSLPSRAQPLNCRAESPQHHTPGKMENNEVAPVPAANDNDTNEAQRVQDWDTFAESSEVKSREELRAARKEHDRNLQEMARAGRLPPITPTNYKQHAKDTGKENRRLQKELGEEKERSQELQDQLNGALNTINDLEQALFNKTQELSALSPEVQLQKIKDLESRVTSLEAENRRLRNAAIEEPQVQAPRRQREPAAIQELDDNMGIDSDEEANDFEDDEEEHGEEDEAQHGEADIGSSE